MSFGAPGALLGLPPPTQMISSTVYQGAFSAKWTQAISLRLAHRMLRIVVPCDLCDATRCSLLGISAAVRIFNPTCTACDLLALDIDEVVLTLVFPKCMNPSGHFLQAQSWSRAGGDRQSINPRDHRRQCRHGQWPAENVSLNQGNAEIQDSFQVCDAFNSLRYHGTAKVPRQLHNRSQHRSPFVIGMRCLHQVGIDFEAVWRGIEDHPVIGLPGSYIVQGNTDLELAHKAQTMKKLGRVPNWRVFHDLDGEPGEFYFALASNSNQEINKHCIAAKGGGMHVDGNPPRFQAGTARQPTRSQPPRGLRRIPPPCGGHNQKARRAIRMASLAGLCSDTRHLRLCNGNRRCEQLVVRNTLVHLAREFCPTLSCSWCLLRVLRRQAGTHCLAQRRKGGRFRQERIGAALLC